MQHYQDDRTTIEIEGRAVIVLPRPLHNPARSEELHRLFPVEEGWNHFHYAVNHTGRTSQERIALARLAEDRVRKLS
jgi:hypothetical protein